MMREELARDVWSIIIDCDTQRNQAAKDAMKLKRRRHKKKKGKARSPQEGSKSKSAKAHSESSDLEDNSSSLPGSSWSPGLSNSPLGAAHSQ